MLEDTSSKNQAIKSLITAVLEKKGMIDDQLMICVVIHDSLSKQEQTKLEIQTYRERFESILNNIEFNRQLQKKKIINTNIELSLAYYGENYGKDQNVGYDEKLEETLISIEKLIREFLGLIMNHILKEEELEI